MKEKKVTIREVAELAGVSISSVSRYLANPKSIQPLAAYNIKNAINELQYEPNMFARNLKRGQTQIVGLIVPHMEYFFGKIYVNFGALAASISCHWSEFRTNPALDF